ncbi:recombinase family protein [Kitasatospora sp. NPDC058965]|uniref:recombinase family protein n=1 Tax=Kitasatospora sp. NPDC058965 TaxID=3346682 RepID=UPI0036749E90
MPVPRTSSDTARRAAVYCWPDPQAAEPTADATGPVEPRWLLALQEKHAREQAATLGLTIAPRHVFADPRPPLLAPPASPAARRGPANPAWSALLATLRAQEFHHLLIPQAEQLAQHHIAFAELLTLATEYGVQLHGHPKDLNDPAVRGARLQLAQRESRSAQQASDRARRAHRRAAADGRTHGGGLRRFGYTPGLTELVPAEAAVVRELFTRYLAGESLRALALDLNQRRTPTAYGNKWTVSGVGRILEAPRYAGLRVLDGQVARTPAGEYVVAEWPPCVTVADWQAAQDLRASRNREQATGRRARREYPLTSLLRCTRCERHMVGSTVGSYPTYACTSNSSLDAEHCSRHIGAESLESHVADRAIALLEALPTPLDPDSPDALDGVQTGPGARFGWARLSPTRRAAVFRHFFATIRIAASSTSRSVFDPTRIEIVARPVGTD